MGVPGGTKKMVKKKKSYLQCRRPQFHPWVRKVYWRKDGDPFSDSWVSLSGPAGKGICLMLRDPGLNIP